MKKDHCNPRMSETGEIYLPRKYSACFENSTPIPADRGLWAALKVAVVIIHILEVAGKDPGTNFHLQPPDYQRCQDMHVLSAGLQVKLASNLISAKELRLTHIHNVHCRQHQRSNANPEVLG